MVFLINADANAQLKAYEARSDAAAKALQKVCFVFPCYVYLFDVVCRLLSSAILHRCILLYSDSEVMQRK